MQDRQWTLRTPRSYSLRAVVHSHGWIQLEPFREAAPGGLSCIIMLADGRPIEVSVRQPSRSLAITASMGLAEAEKRHVNGSLRRMLGLSQDLEPFYQAARREPRLARVPEDHLGRLLRSATIFEDVVKAILTTNTTWSGTLRMVTRLVDAYGTPVPGLDSRRAFPTPAQLAVVPAEELRKGVGLGYRAPYVAELANREIDGSLNLSAFARPDVPTAELRKRLLAIKGVGPYAAATLLMLLGRYDYVPVDSWALRLVSHEWYGGASVGSKEVESAFEEWGPWKALAYWFWDWELLRQMRT